MLRAPHERRQVNHMDDKTTKKPCLLRAADRAKQPEMTMSHPFNPKSEIHGHTLGDATGLSRIGLHVLRIPPGKESFVYHRHFGEEEFVYILSGRGIAEIDDQEYEVGPGDFMGFPTPSVGHHLKNPFEEDLVYISGGERNPVEVADFPRLGKTAARAGMMFSVFKTDDAESPFGMPKIK
jgi:uncharacterized cupin superfamily protein